MVNIEEIREAANGPPRLRAQSGAAIQQMLSRIVRGIADERLRVDDQPRLSIRTKDVSGVEVGREERVGGRAVRQFLEEAKPLTDERCIGPVLGLRTCLGAPAGGHFR